MKKYLLHSISPFSLFKFGCFIGLIVSFLPILLTTLLFLNLASKLLGWLDNLATQPTIQLPIIGQIPIDINILQLLGLQDFYARLNSIVAVGAIQALLLSIFFTLIFALSVAILSLLAGVAFNLISAVTGGLQITLSEKAIRRAAQPANLPTISHPPGQIVTPGREGLNSPNRVQDAPISVTTPVPSQPPGPRQTQ